MWYRDLKENINKNDVIIREFKDRYYSHYVFKNVDNDSAGFQMAITCLAIFMLTTALILGFIGNTVVAVCSYISSITFVIIPVVISIVKLYLFGEKRILNQNRLQALDKTFEDYLGKDSDYSRQLQLIEALKESYLKSAEGILGSIVKFVMFLLIQVTLFALSLLSNFLNWDTVGVKGVYIWIAINLFIAILDKYEVIKYLLYNDLLLFVSRDYQKELSMRILSRGRGKVS